MSINSSARYINFKHTKTMSGEGKGKGKLRSRHSKSSSSDIFSTPPPQKKTKGKGLSWRDLFQKFDDPTTHFITKEDLKPIAMTYGFTETSVLSNFVPVFDGLLSDHEKMKELMQGLVQLIASGLLIGCNGGDDDMDYALVWKDYENREPSQEALCEYSLLSHAVRSFDWNIFGTMNLQFGRLRLQNDSVLLDSASECLELLSDDRVCQIFSDISGLNKSEVTKVLEADDFLRVVSWRVAVRGWVTPDGVCLNVPALPTLKNHIFPLMIVLGQETAHYLSRLSSCNFAQGTPEKRRNENKVKTMVESLSKTWKSS
jgi:hypothetical protein